MSGGISSVFIGSGFAICGLIMMLLIAMIFLVKNKRWDLQSTLFFYASAVTIVLLVLEIVVSYTIVNRNLYPTLNTFLSRTYIFFNILWFFVATQYVISVVKKIDDKKKEKLFTLIYIILSLISSLLVAILFNLSFDTCIKGQPCFISGSFYIMMKIISILSSSSHMLIMFLNRKKIKNIRMTPIFFLGAVFTLTNIFLFFIDKELNTLTITLALTITILFFTTENQDIKLIDEYESMKKESVKSNKAKTDFLINMSHEIRTPLTTILGFGQTLLYKENLTEEDLKTDVLNIKKANNTLVSLISSLSDISRLENNKDVLNEADYNLESLIFEIYSFIPPKINKDNLKFNIKVNPDIPKKYYGDASKIFKALSYVILNAIEYTNYGEVTLSVDAHKKENAFYELEFIISNTGHAMKEEIFNISFEDYIELDDKANNNNLGLIIAKKMIEICSGNIEFINKPGQGTKYVIKINQKNYTETEKIGNVFDNHEHTNLLLNLLDCSDKKALVVDDKPENIAVFTEYLENYNFKISTAKNGKEAIEAIQRERYDIVFLDYTMPGLNGIETINSLKSLLQQLPIIILVFNVHEEENVKDAINDGIDGTITKPIKFKELNKIIVSKFKE